MYEVRELRSEAFASRRATSILRTCCILNGWLASTSFTMDCGMSAYGYAHAQIIMKSSRHHITSAEDGHPPGCPYSQCKTEYERVNKRLRVSISEYLDAQPSYRKTNQVPRPD